MADINKTIKDIEECLSASCRGYKPKVYCPHSDEEWDIMRDALELLKERQPRKPHYTTLKYIVKGEEVSVKHPECPKCVENRLFLWDAEIERGQAFCKRCGQAIDWSKEATNREKDDP